MQERAAEISGNGLTAQSSGSFAFTAFEWYLLSTLGERDCSQRVKSVGKCQKSMELSGQTRGWFSKAIRDLQLGAHAGF